MKSKLRILIIIGIVMFLTAFPLIFLSNASFSGADDQAEKAITNIDPDYKPWAKSMFQPSAETESMLFALQAAIGGGIIGYGFGRLSAKKKYEEETK